MTRAEWLRWWNLLKATHTLHLDPFAPQLALSVFHNSPNHTTLCAPSNGLGSVSDVFISVWLLSGELAGWAALSQRYTDHNTMQTMSGELLRAMQSTEPANWNRLCVCVCVRERVLLLYVWYPKITLTLQQDHVDISQWPYGTVKWVTTFKFCSVHFHHPYCPLYNRHQTLPPVSLIIVLSSFQTVTSHIVTPAWSNRQYQGVQTEDVWRGSIWASVCCNNPSVFFWHAGIGSFMMSTASKWAISGAMWVSVCGR